MALDISKAFDRVWHDRLCCKLNSYGIGQDLVLLIRSFLTDRSIQVVLDGVSSTKHSLNAGVPQGSVLSPTLFLIFIDDLLKLTVNPIHSFADDSTLHCSFQFNHPVSRTLANHHRQLVTNSLNDDLSKIFEWGSHNMVTFNASKTQTTYFTNKRLDVEPNHTIQFDNANTSYSTVGLNILGINLSDKLLWNDHIRSVALQAARRLGFLRRCSKYISRANKLLIYKAFIRPVLEYNSHLWAGAPISSLKIVDSIQKRAIRILCCSDSDIQSLDHRRTVGCLSLFYRYYHGHCSQELFNLMPDNANLDPRLRSSLMANRFAVTIERSRTARYSNTFLPRTSKLWNAVPDWVFPLTYNIQKFKNNLNQFLINNPLI